MSRKPFIDENHPDIGKDKIVLDFNDRPARQSLKVFAKLIEDDELRDRIEIRCKQIDRLEKLANPPTPHKKSTPEEREIWREQNRKRAQKREEKEAEEKINHENNADI